MQAPPILLYKKIQGNCRAQDASRDRDAHFVRACAVEMHMDMSEEDRRGILYGNLQGKCRTLPIPPRLNTAPYITVTVRTPQCDHTVWEKM
jgi:hypothetical protein